MSFNDNINDTFKETFLLGRSIKEEEGLVYNGYALSNLGQYEC